MGIRRPINPPDSRNAGREMAVGRWPWSGPTLCSKTRSAKSFTPSAQSAQSPFQQRAASNPSQLHRTAPQWCPSPLGPSAPPRTQTKFNFPALSPIFCLPRTHRSNRSRCPASSRPGCCAWRPPPWCTPWAPWLVAAALPGMVAGLGHSAVGFVLALACV